MAVFFDILLIAVLALTVIKHCRLGLACSVLNAMRFVFAILVAVLLCYPVAAIVRSLGVSEALSGIIAFVIIFVVTLILSKLLIKLLSKIKIPLITKLDKFLGFVLGLVLGAVFVSLAATTLYTVIEFISLIGDGGDIMQIYEDSYVFKFIYDLKLFDFIRNLF